MQDGRVHPFWVARDRKAYTGFEVQNLRIAKGIPPLLLVDSRWFNLGKTIAESERDLCLHREGKLVRKKTSESTPACINFEPDLRPKNWGS